MPELFSIHRRPPSEEECREFARRFRDCCEDWSNYLGDPVYFTTDGEEEDAESLREELAAARRMGLSISSGTTDCFPASLSSSVIL